MKFLQRSKWFFVGLVLIIIPVVFVYKKLFLAGPAVWGDAPYFFPEGLKELVSFPSSWTTRDAFLGGANNFLWIYPLMLLYGLFGKIFSLNNDIIIRLLFYFPSLICGGIGAYLFSRSFKFGKVVSFFAALIYLINTYFILLVDGGQVGVVLAYGLFPITLVLLRNKNYLISILSFFILTIVDFRISVICLITYILINGLRDWKKIILISLTTIGLSAYWLILVVKLSAPILSTDVSKLQLTSFLNPLLLFHPLWPLNEFGKAQIPPFYFIGIPFLVFGSLILGKMDKKVIYLLIVFMFFAFLIKGETPPLGSIYSFLINKIPYGIVFRDSTKFFIPLILLAGVLIGKTTESLKFKPFYLLIYFYILLLATPAILGDLNGVLGKNISLTSFDNIHNLENKQNGFLRSVWFTEKNPFAFNLKEKQAIDAKDLADLRPIASINAGDGDRFNFLNNNTFTDWFNLLGIKYLIFSGNPRKVTPNEAEQRDWARLLNLVQVNKDLKKVDINTDFPVYELTDVKPNIFVVDKTYFVVGGDDIYQKLEKTNPNFSVGNQGFVFLEDGKFDPNVLNSIASSSGSLIFNDKNNIDLVVSFLQRYFLSPDTATKTQWAVRKSSDFLKWKFELLENKIDTHEFDYGKGVAFSSVPHEMISFKLSVLSDGDYYLVSRTMSASNSANIKLNFNGSSNEITRKKDDDFEWYTNGPMTLKKGEYDLTIENVSGFSVFNTAGLIPVNEYTSAQEKEKSYINIFGITSLDKPFPISRWKNYDPANLPTNSWVIFTDKFDKNWENSVPFYSMINGFYTGDGNNFRIYYKGEEYLRWGIYVSGVTLFVVVILALYKLAKLRK